MKKTGSVDTWLDTVTRYADNVPITLTRTRVFDTEGSLFIDEEYVNANPHLFVPLGSYVEGHVRVYSYRFIGE